MILELRNAAGKGGKTEQPQKEMGGDDENEGKGAGGGRETKRKEEAHPERGGDDIIYQVYLKK